VSGVIAAWLAFAVSGWLLESLVLTMVGPLFLMAVPVILARRDPGGIDPLEPIWALVLLFGLTYFLIPALAIIDEAPFSPLGGYLDQPPMQRALASWVASLAFLALVAGYRVPWGRRGARFLPSGRIERPDIVGGTAFTFFVLGVASVVALAVINHAWRLGVGDLLTGGMRRAAVASVTGRGYLSVGFMLLALAAPCGAMWAVLAGGGRWRWTVVALAGVVSMVLLGGVTGSRIFALSVPVGVFVVIHYRVRRIAPATAALAAAAVLAAGVGQLVIRDQAKIDSPLEAAGALTLTLGGFDFLTTALARVDDFMLGQPLAEDIFVAYVPRAVWTAKPSTYGFIRTQEAVVPGLYADLAKASTFPVGPVAEGYVNFGVAGALMFPFLIGLVYRALYERLLLSPDAFAVLLLGWALPNVLSAMRGLGPLIPATAVAAVVLSPLVLFGAKRTK
jgi:hypothetical protein